MTDEEALIRAILTHPAEDTPRLVYADWLDEHGRHERAHLIHSTSESWHGAHDAGTALAMCGVPGVVILSPARAVIRLGFVEELECPAADWLAHADALYWHPTQTVRCPAECMRKWTGGYGVANPSGYGWGLCPVCAGTGRVQRPCPLTAQAIRRVTLTTWPEFEIVPNDTGNRYRLPGRGPLRTLDQLIQFAAPGGVVACLCAAEFPGVKFELPTEPGMISDGFQGVSRRIEATLAAARRG